MAEGSQRTHALRWLWLAVGVFVADQLTKAAIVAAFRDGGGLAITPFFTLVLTYNTGAAFSFLAGASGWQRWLFAGIAAVAAIVIVVLLRRGGSTMYGPCSRCPMVGIDEISRCSRSFWPPRTRPTTYRVRLPHTQPAVALTA